MKKLTLLLVVSICIYENLFAQAPDTLWTKAFGGTGYDFGYSVQQTSDGGYIITGYYGATGDTGSYIFIIKTNSNGDSLWTKIFGERFKYDHCNSVRQTSDGGYIITGYTSSFGAGRYDAWLIRIEGNASAIEQLGIHIVTKNYSLLQNFPNPFNPTTTITYTIPNKVL